MGWGPFSSDSKTYQTTTNQNAGFSEVAGSAVAIQGTGNVIGLSDQGAISAAQTIALGSFDFARESLRQVEIAGGNTVASVGRALSAVTESARSETENVSIQAFKWGAIAVIAWALFGASKTWFGKG